MKNNKKLTERILVRTQFNTFYSLQQKIGKLNDVNRNYHEGDLSIGIRSEHITMERYVRIFEKMENEQTYTMTLSDDSLLCLYYEFDKTDSITMHELSYIPSYRIDNGNGQYEDDINPFELINRARNYIRIDFGSKGYKEYTHTLIHAHFGPEKGDVVRIPVEHTVLPYEFLFFILKYVYHVNDDELRFLCGDVGIIRDSKLSINEKKRVRLLLSDCIQH